MENKAIFWDFDGTLVYSNESFTESLLLSLSEYGYDIDFEIVKDFMKNTCSWYMPEREYINRTKEAWWMDILDKFYFFCNKNQIAKNNIVPIFDMFRKNVINYNYIPYSDSEKILLSCKEKGFKNYILSNNFPELTHTIKRFHWESLFTDIYLSTNIGYEKPRKEIFHYAIEKSNRPEILYMVGDNPIADIRGAATAGINTIWVHGKPTQTCNPKYKCIELSEILTIL